MVNDEIFQVYSGPWLFRDVTRRGWWLPTFPDSLSVPSFTGTDRLTRAEADNKRKQRNIPEDQR